MNGIYFESLEEYKIEKKEYCFLKENTDRHSDFFKVLIPKLMPLFNLQETPKVINNIFNNKIFVNSSECPIVSASKIKTQNYLTIKRKKNTWFRLHPQTFEKYTRLMAEIPERDIRNIQLTDDEFNTDSTEKKDTMYIMNPLYDFISKITVGDSVKFIVKTYYNRQLETCPDNEEHFDNESHDLSNPRPQISHIHNGTSGCSGSLSVLWPDPVCKISKYDTHTGIVSRLTEWGCYVQANGRSYPVPITNIIGFYKKAGEYSSFYKDSEGGK